MRDTGFFAFQSICDLRVWSTFGAIVCLGNLCVFLFDRRTDPFSEDLLPTEVPPLLHGLPDEDVMSDDEM